MSYPGNRKSSTRTHQIQDGAGITLGSVRKRVQENSIPCRAECEAHSNRVLQENGGGLSNCVCTRKIKRFGGTTGSVWEGV